MASAEYDPIGVTKSRICCLLANSEKLRNVIDYKGIDPAYPYDPDQPLSLIWNCIIPILKDPDTITTKDPQILVGVDGQVNYNDPRSQILYATINIIVDNTDVRTNERYLREDLLKDGVCAYTKADLIAHYVRQVLSQPSKTWIGDVELVESTEGATNNTTHYGRSIRLMIKEVDLDNRGV